MSELEFVPQKPRPFRTSRTVVALMLREMSTTYGRSAFGYLWAVVEPGAGILLLTIIFSLMLNSPPLGTNFPLYYASGILPFLVYMDVNIKTAKALDFSRPLMSFPTVTYADALIARIVLNGLTQIVVVGLTLATLVISFRIDLVFDFPAAILGVFMALSLAAGIGVLNCFLFSQYPSWERIWGIANRPMFIISCIFFLFESVPQPFRDYLWFNPLVHVVGQFRKGIYPTYDGSYVSIIYVMGISLICGVMGLLLLRRHHRDMLNR